jgi:hypothetical protein
MSTLAILVFAAACTRSVTPPAEAARPPEFVSETFQQLYPVFLHRHSMPLGEKAKLWTERYFGRYVRWTGIIRSFTPNGVTLKHLPTTVTFDVSVWMEADQAALVQKRYHVGDVLTYVARLDSYDDVFRTLYLGHGLITETPDGAVPTAPPEPGK